jgi:hypothetical protein
MKIGKKSLRGSDGKIKHFKSEKARDNYERVAEAVKHGWKPTGKGKKK